MIPAQAERRLAEIAFVYGAEVGIGGLGTQAANALGSLATSGDTVHAFGPGHSKCWQFERDVDRIRWNRSRKESYWASQYTWRRWYHGRFQTERDRLLGAWAAREIEHINPRFCYTFSQVGLETLKWAKPNKIPTVLETPTGHIRDFRRLGETESRRWLNGRYRGHPSKEMVERVEEEYRKADFIRVSSKWSKLSLASFGVPMEKIHVLQQPVDLNRFQPPTVPRSSDGPLRVCFVGFLGLHKGFVYLLRAMKLLGAGQVKLEIVGSTGSRGCSRLFQEEQKGLDVTCAPGDPVNAYHRAELFVFPTLTDGSPFAVAEAMACGLPVVVTDSCGAAEWVNEESGWVVPSRSEEALAAAMEKAILNRRHLGLMGRAARIITERRAGGDCFEALGNWLKSTVIGGIRA